jgi:hypothetical protein
MLPPLCACRGLRVGQWRRAHHRSAISKHRRTGPLGLAKLPVLPQRFEPLGALAAAPLTMAVRLLPGGPDLVDVATVGTADRACVGANGRIDHAALDMLCTRLADLAVITNLTLFANLALFARLPIFTSLLPLGAGLLAIVAVVRLSNRRHRRHGCQKNGEYDLTHLL